MHSLKQKYSTLMQLSTFCDSQFGNVHPSVLAFASTLRVSAQSDLNICGYSVDNKDPNLLQAYNKDYDQSARLT